MKNLTIKNTSLPDIIELKNIKQVYNNNKVILDNFNLLIEDAPDRGQFVSILGPSGCGKSTILRYIANLQKPTEGEVLLHGKPITDEHVGMVFQQYSSFPWLTVLENVELPLTLQNIKAKEKRERAMEFINVCELTEHKNKFAQYPILSGGQLQRVAIARSLVSNPHLLLMDEPFGALDINTRLKMQDMVISLWNQLSDIQGYTTVLFITHDIAEAVYLSTDIYLMSANPGQIVEHIPIEFDFKHKDRSIKRDKKFIAYVQEIEDKMMDLTK